MTSRVISVVGAGRMGTAIAYTFANTGHDLRLHDTSAGARDWAQSEIARVASLCGTATPPVSVHDDLVRAVDGADLVIETATENADIKRRILTDISGAVADNTVISTNTSSIPLRNLAPSVSRPERFLGTHFWNPAYAVTLVEVVSHQDTTDACVQSTAAALRDAGFHPVPVRVDIPGLIGNRLQHALKREAIALVAAGICDAETVDTVAKLTLGARLEVLGPLEQSDLVGLDLTVAIHESLIPDLDRSDQIQPYLTDLVAAGHLGMKTGQGFRAWTVEQADEVRDRLDRHLLRGRPSNTQKGSAT